jgi:hypothetical protein
MIFPAVSCADGQILIDPPIMPASSRALPRVIEPQKGMITPRGGYHAGHLNSGMELGD